VEDDINTINYLVQHKDIKNVSMDEINKATQSLNKGKSADYHGLTIEHIIYAGKEIQLFAGLHECPDIFFIIQWIDFKFENVKYISIYLTNI
jgi:hypothetical protein